MKETQIFTGDLSRVIVFTIQFPAKINSNSIQLLYNCLNQLINFLNK
jgi:hypothetical protein